MDKVRLAGCGEVREWTDCWALLCLAAFMLAGYGVLLRCEWEETKTRREKRKERRDDPGLGRLVMLYFSVCCFEFLGLG